MFSFFKAKLFSCEVFPAFFMKQYIQSVLPYEIIEAARVDGSSEFRTFNQIVLPIIKPALSVQFIFAFVASWNNLFIPSLIIQDGNTTIWSINIETMDSQELYSQAEDKHYIEIRTDSGVILISELSINSYDKILRWSMKGLIIN